MTSLLDQFQSQPPFAAFLADIAELGVRPVQQGGLRYAVVAARSNPRWWLVPLDSRRATAAGFEMLQPVTTTARLAKMSAQTLARFGPHRFLGKGILRLSGMPDLGGAFDGAAAHVAYFTGTDGPHRKTAVQVMSETGGILGYAKFSRAAHLRPYLRNEAEMLARIGQMSLNSADFPSRVAFQETDAFSVLVTDSLKTRGHAAPRTPDARHIAFLQDLRAKTELRGAQPVLTWIERQAQALAPVAGEAWQTRLMQVANRLRPTAADMALCLTHGDFTPWNTFVQGQQFYVFDWEYAQPAWPVGFDLTHFLLASMGRAARADQFTELRKRLAEAHFGGDCEAAQKALLLSLACHACFYLGRLAEVRAPLRDWADGPMRAALIDRILASSEEAI